jgi:hypothetical protein
VDDGVLAQPGHFVFHKQLATLQLYDLQVIDRRMGACVVDFLFQRAVPSLQFRKMRFYGHAWWSPRRLSLTQQILHQNGAEVEDRSIVQCSNPGFPQIAQNICQDTAKG